MKNAPLTSFTCIQMAHMEDLDPFMNASYPSATDTQVHFHDINRKRKKNY